MRADQLRSTGLRAVAPAAGIALAVAWLGWQNGGVGQSQIAGTTIVLGAVLVGVAPLLRARPALQLALGAFVLYAAETFASAWWAPSAEGAVADFDRVALYVLLLAAVALLPWPRSDQWLDGVAAGLVLVVAVALVSRFDPGRFSDRGLSAALPSARARLSFPIGYWNGLAAIAAIAIPLLASRATGKRRLVGAIAVACIPACGCVLYLTSSRGAIAGAVIGSAVFLAATSARLRATAAFLAGAAGAAVAAAYASAQQAVVAGVTTPAAHVEGRHAAAVLLAASVAAGGLFFVGAPSADRRLRRPAGRVVAGLCLIAAVLAAALADLPSRLAAFRALPSSPSASGFTTTHLLTSGGNGRWQFWTAGLDEFRAHPAVGGGSGSFGEWWNRHGSFAYVVHDAHSLYVETLAELGVIGLVALVALLVVAAVVGAGRCVGGGGGARAAAAAALGGAAAWAVAAGLDWLWELPAVSAPAVVLIGLALRGERAAGELSTVRRRAATAAVVLAVGAIVAAEVLPLAAGLSLRESQSAVRNGQLDHALSLAHQARSFTPWAASPRLQAALVAEEMNRLPLALDEIDAAIARDDANWQLWLVRARIETKRGELGAAARSLKRARALDPLEPLLRDLS